MKDNIKMTLKNGMKLNNRIKLNSKMKQKSKGSKMKIFLFLLTAIFFVGCAPKVYVIDRHTLMEQDAQGEWPELEKELFKRNQKKGSTFFNNEKLSTTRQRAYNVLHGDLVK